MSIFAKYPGSSFLSTLNGHIIDLPQRIDELFCALDGLEDSNFSTALDADPQARIWEMMVAAILKASGLTANSSEGYGPDFTVICPGFRIAIEAICPTPGEIGRPDSVPPLKPQSDYQLVPINPLLLRIRGAISDKKRVFDAYGEKDIISCADACVIAISSAKLNRAKGFWPCLCMTATLGYGSPCAAFDSRTGERVKEGFQFQKEVLKTNGNRVDTLVFLDDSYSNIAGVLYSEASLFSLNFDLIEETYFIHNPKANRGVPSGTFKVGHELWTVLSSDGTSWKTYEIGQPRKPKTISPF